MDREGTLYGTPGAGRDGTLMSPASRNIEKSLIELDDLITKRRAELSHLRSSNRVYSADKLFQEGREKATPPNTHNGANHVHTAPSSASSSSISSIRSHSSTSPYLASNIPSAIINSSGTSPGYLPHGSGIVSDKTMGSAYSTRPPLYTSPTPYGSTYYNEFSRNTSDGVTTDSRSTASVLTAGNHHGRVSDSQDMITITSSKYNELGNQLQYFQRKVSELESESQVASEELMSTKGDLLFLRTQLQTKSDEIADLKNLKTTRAISAHSNGEHDYKAYYEDAVKENELWAQKVEEIEKEKRILEDDLKRAEKAIFDWEAGWGQLEGDCIALQDQLRRKDYIISSLTAKQVGALQLSFTTLRRTICRQIFTSWRRSVTNKKQNLQFFTANNIVEHSSVVDAEPLRPDNSSVEETGLRRRNNQINPVEEDKKPYLLPPSASAEQLQQQMQFVQEAEKHNVSYLVILAFLQFLVWIIVLVFGYIYLENNSGVDVRALLQGYSLTWGSKTYEASEVIDSFKSYF